jgi:hypothetical protein
MNEFWQGWVAGSGVMLRVVMLIRWMERFVGHDLKRRP